MDYEDFYYECWSNISESEISHQDFYENENTLRDLTYHLYRLHHMSGNLNPHVAARVITYFFENFVN